MKAALIILLLAAAYLVGQLLIIWRSRNSNIPPKPPDGWREGDWDDEDDDWPQQRGN